MVTDKKINYYEILEISYDADEASIKSSYRRLARKYHPDVSSEKFASEKFKQITEAYETLSNKAKRNQYDLLNNFVSVNKEIFRTEAKKAYQEQKKPQPSPYRHTYKQAKDTKNNFSDIFSDILDGLKFNTTNQKTTAINGSNIYTNVTISYKESIEGTTRTVNVLHTEQCAKCKGKKFVNEVKCPLCQGKGETSIQKKLNVKIPPFVHNGSKIRIANEGNQGINGGLNGDIYLTVLVEKNKNFTCEGNNILLELPITPFEAALGANIEVKSLPNNFTIKIPPCTSSGQKFRLSGLGLKDANQKSGDVVVTVKIIMPEKLTLEEQSLYEKLKVANKTNIREI